jgi:hypothetical protein
MRAFSCPDWAAAISICRRLRQRAQSEFARRRQTELAPLAEQADQRLHRVGVLHRGVREQHLAEGQVVLHHAAQPAAGVAHELGALRVRDVVGNTGRGEGPAVGISEVPGGIQHEHRMLLRHRVELGEADRRRPGLQRGVEIAPHDPLPRRRGPGLRHQVLEHLRGGREAGHADMVHQAVDHGAGHHMGVRFDEARQHDPAAQVDHPGLRAGGGPHRRVAADRDDLVAPDRDGFGLREAPVHRQDLAAGEHGGGGALRTRHGGPRARSGDGAAEQRAAAQRRRLLRREPGGFAVRREERPESAAATKTFVGGVFHVNLRECTAGD